MSCHTDITLFPILYELIVHAKATVELGKIIQQITLPNPPSLQDSKGLKGVQGVVFRYPHFVEFLGNSVRFFDWAGHLIVGSQSSDISQQSCTLQLSP